MKTDKIINLLALNHSENVYMLGLLAAMCGDLYYDQIKKAMQDYISLYEQIVGIEQEEAHSKYTS